MNTSPVKWFHPLRKKTIVALLVLIVAACSTAPTVQFSRGRLKMPEESESGLEPVVFLRGPMPTGVAISRSGRVFVNFPRWGDSVKFTVAELREKDVRAYPSQPLNEGRDANDGKLISAQSVVVDDKDRLWIVDTGSINFGPVAPGMAKLVGVNLETNQVFRTIPFPEDVVPSTSYLNDVRFDLNRGADGMAYLTDSGDKGLNGIIVVDLASGKSWRRLGGDRSTVAERNFVPNVEGRPLLNRPASGAPSPLRMGSDGIAIDRSGGRLYYCPLIGHHLYSVSLEALSNPLLNDEGVRRTVVDHGDRGFASDGILEGPNGKLYLTDYENNAIRVRERNGAYSILAQSPHLLWPDSLALSSDGYLYFTVNQLHRQARFQGGRDERQQPYVIYRLPIRSET
ncbi:MAG: L-dopachrome tautomerase-related protein [Bdellovibrionota bacterium]